MFCFFFFLRKKLGLKMVLKDFGIKFPGGEDTSDL